MWYVLRRKLHKNWFTSSHEVTPACGMQLDIAKVIPDEEQNKLEGDLKSLEE